MQPGGGMPPQMGGPPPQQPQPGTMMPMLAGNGGGGGLMIKQEEGQPPEEMQGPGNEQMNSVAKWVCDQCVMMYKRMIRMCYVITSTYSMCVTYIVSQYTTDFEHVNI